MLIIDALGFFKKKKESALQYNLEEGGFGENLPPTLAVHVAIPSHSTTATRI